MVWAPYVAEVEGRFVAASNATLLGVTDRGEPVVYKPVRGERPLWDFPTETLARREVLTFEMSQLLDIGVVPETALGDGIYGPGSVQRFVDIDEEWDAVPAIQRADAMLWPIAVLDLVCNNADRKVGHILRTVAGQIVGIDHGLTFHDDDKLRTVLWTFAGQPIPEHLRAAVSTLPARLDGDAGERFRSWLTAAEWRALRGRIASVTDSPVHPEPPLDRPPLPWPPY